MERESSDRPYGGTVAENYERHFVPAVANPVASDLLELARLQPSERVLDLACGTGVIARAAAKRVGLGGQVAGVDLAPSMIEVARSLPAPSEAAEITWSVGGAESLPLPNDLFDVVLCQMGLMFVEDKPAALAEVRRVLVTGGRLVLSTPGTIQRPFEIMDEAIARHIDPGLAGFVRMVFSMSDPDALERLLVAAGFEDVETANPTTPLRLPPPADFLWQYIGSTPLGPAVANAPEEAKDALEVDVVQSWREFVEEGSTVVDQPMVLATGREPLRVL